jgi:hypothetical protein
MATLVERYCRGVEALCARGPGALDDFLGLHDETVRFVDPLREVVGREAFGALLARLLGEGRAWRFEAVEASGEGDVGFFTWVLARAPGRAAPPVVYGATHLRAQRGLVVFRRDYWDVASAVAESVPPLGALYRRALARLG